jgi:hypothetical protein
MASDEHDGRPIGHWLERADDSIERRSRPCSAAKEVTRMVRSLEGAVVTPSP